MLDNEAKARAMEWVGPRDDMDKYGDEDPRAEMAVDIKPFYDRVEGTFGFWNPDGTDIVSGLSFNEAADFYVALMLMLFEERDDAGESRGPDIDFEDDEWAEGLREWCDGLREGTFDDMREHAAKQLLAVEEFAHSPESMGGWRGRLARRSGRR